MRPSLRSKTSLVGAVFFLVPAVALGQSIVPVDEFRSLTLHNGGHVIVRHGASQKVTLLKGAEDCVQATIEHGDRLVIEHGHGCRERHAAMVEIVTPDLDAVAVTDGGTIRTSGDFPRQTDLAVAVESGGAVDLRSIRVDNVTAAVQDGGRILVRAQKVLTASIANGGAITYWDSPHVASSVNRGGIVARGKPADLDTPLDELGITNAPVPPVPPVAPVPSRKVRGTI